MTLGDGLGFGFGLGDAVLPGMGTMVVCPGIGVRLGSGDGVTLGAGVGTALGQ